MADVFPNSIHDRPGRGAKTCALCGRSDDLQASHIIPKFVGKWLKDTSATGSLAQTDGNDVEHAQDLPTYHMLCSDCEQRFSSLEKSFADKVFYPFHKSGDSRLEYGSWLERFAISLGWRVLKAGYEAFKSERPEFSPHMELAEASWREFLLGDKQTVRPYESHLFFLGSAEAGVGIPKKFNWYSRRAIDYTIAANDTRMFTYAKLADMVFVTSIRPNVLKGWTGTRIDESGVIASPHIINDGDFGEFLLNRAEVAFPYPLRPSPLRERRLQKAFQKDRTKALESDSIQISTEEMVLSYKRRMRGMPQSVTSLVDVIGNQVASTKAETVADIWRSRGILDALAGLSAEEADKLDGGISATINQMIADGRSTRYRLVANTIRVIFIANYNSKADQHTVVKEQAELEEARSRYVTPFAIFSMNYEGDGVSFESIFMVPPDRSP